MLLSIIIPVYNIEPYIRECLEPLFAQDLTDCEVIVVNDGSTDGSRSILSEYKECYPDVLTIVDEANGGLSMARNAGVERAKGEYLCFLDGDDYLKLHAIISIKKAIETSENADVIYLDCMVTDKGERWEEHEGKEVLLMDLRSFFQYAFEHKIDIVPNAVSYIFSSKYWKKANLHFEAGIKYEDALFKYQLYVRKDGTIKIVHMAEPFYVYRIGREGSISTKLTLKNFTDRKYVREQIAKLLSENGISALCFRHALFDHGLSALLEAYKSDCLSQRKKFWSNQDWKWMRQGVCNSREYSLYLLACIHPRWMARYYYDDLPKLFRRIINIVLTVAVRLLYK